MEDAVYYIPILTTVLSLYFAWVVLRRYRSGERAPLLLWWAPGILLFGVGTFMEGFTALFGWNEVVFRSWYISGALLGGAPLAQGTVYLLIWPPNRQSHEHRPRRVRHGRRRVRLADPAERRGGQRQQTFG